MEIAAVTHVAVVDEHEVFVLVHMECDRGSGMGSGPQPLTR